jgi:hypothetical protein
MPANTAPSTTVGIVGGLQQVARRGADEAGLDHAGACVARKISDDFAAAHRIADECSIAQLQLADHRRKIVGERIEVVTGSRFVGASEPSAVVSHDAVARFR